MDVGVDKKGDQSITLPSVNGNLGNGENLAVNRPIGAISESY